MAAGISLTEIAETAMREKGFFTTFSQVVVDQLNKMQEPEIPKRHYRDLRHLLWVSIDNDDSEDLDQLTYAEADTIYIAVAHVAALVKKGSPIDNHAAHNTTSVYTPSKIFPMLPLKLSTDLTSLNENQDRCAIVVEIAIKDEGSFELIEIYPSIVHNHAKLTYNGVGDFLDKGIELSKKQKGLLEQLTLQDRHSKAIYTYRHRTGALGFATLEVKPIMLEGLAIGLKEVTLNSATALIENFMIAANVCVSHYFAKKKIPTLRRIVRTPERWDRIIELARFHGTELPPMPHVGALRDFLVKEQRKDPEGFHDLSLAVIKLIGRGEYHLWIPGTAAMGHFNLALEEYAHTTAPNRRYPDLLMQRLLMAHLDKSAIPYNKEELATLAMHCTQKEDDATKVERRVYKSAAAMVLQPRIGEQFSALVTGASEKGTWVRLIDPPIEGKLIRGYKGTDVGDRVHVQLIDVDIVKGHIDFARV